MRSINPTVKAAAVITAAVFLAFSFSALWMLIIIIFCFLTMLFYRANLKTMLKALIPATLAAAALACAIYLSGSDSVVAGFSIKALASTTVTQRAVAVGLRIYSYFFLGMTFALTTDNLDFIYSLMQQCRVKPKYAYGILAAFNLIPQINRQIKQIRLAYRIRGYHLFYLSPRVLFSALVNAIRWSESLAMAMESKGFEEEGKRTYHRKVTVSPVDIIWAAVLIAISVCSVFIK